MTAVQAASVRAPDPLLERLRAQRACCPTDAAAARAHHDAVKVDAATGAPVTAHGRQLLATLRPWPDLGARVGECTCGSSLLLLDDPDAEDVDDA